MTRELVERLSVDITSGRLPPGSRLPTEQEMIAATGVSRTVVREAVSALRAEGLVVTRQGVGAFVADTPRRPFRVEIEAIRNRRDIIALMELRTGIEVEAVGLATERASGPERDAVIQACEALELALDRGESAIEQDFEFHCRIAEAAGNPQFHRFLQYLGVVIIPRYRAPVVLDTPEERQAFRERIRREHRAIVEPFLAHDPETARTAMRRHLLASRELHQKLADRGL